MSQPLFLTKLHLKNYKSIRDETVTFANPLILVGRNGSGKSNFVDALAFLSECADSPLQSIIKSRGGIYGLCSQIGNGRQAAEICVRADFEFGSEDKTVGHYSFEIDTSLRPYFQVRREQCILSNAEGRTTYFEREGDHFNTNVTGIQPAVEAQSLALPVIGGVKEFSQFVKELGAMRLYSIDPAKLKGVKQIEHGSDLEQDGSNAASVLLQIRDGDPSSLGRMRELLSVTVPGIIAIIPHTAGNNVGLSLAQQGENGSILGFLGASLSDGTLRGIGLLAAVMQKSVPTVMAIEEPEASIHPGAYGAIADLIDMAAQRSQVVITTYSPELLDTKWIAPENIRVVQWEQGATRISPLGDAPVKALQQHLMGAGELLRANALDAAPPTEASQDDLFEKIAA